MAGLKTPHPIRHMTGTFPCEWYSSDTHARTHAHHNCSTLRAGVEVVEVVDDGASDVASTSESQTSGTSTARMSMLSSVAALWTARHRGGRKQNTGGPQPIRTNREPVVMEPTAVIMDTESPLARAGPNATAVTGESAALGGTPRKRGLHDIHTMQQ